MLSERDIAQIGQRIVGQCRPLAVGYFGSYAIGTAHHGSDLDLFIIMRTNAPPAARTLAVLRRLGGVLHPMDIHVFTPQEIEAALDEYLSFGWIVAHQAIYLHVAPEAEALVAKIGARTQATHIATNTE